jgi:hypothetical protein
MILYIFPYCRLINRPVIFEFIPQHVLVTYNCPGSQAELNPWLIIGLVAGLSLLVSAGCLLDPLWPFVAGVRLPGFTSG